MHLCSPGTAVHRPLRTALGLSLAAAISLGMARFSYALLLPPMLADLGWSYLLAGAMNTANASGYLLGALATPALLRRFPARSVLVGGAASTGVLMLLPGFVSAPELLLSQRVASGIASACLFIAGGVLAARLGAVHPERAGLLIGIYYGGTGLGIAASALLVPAMSALATAHAASHAWQWAWLALGAACLVVTRAMGLAARTVDEPPSAVTGPRARVAWRPLAWCLGGYFMFGVGYIGYMTFIVALLNEHGMTAPMITTFYSTLGLTVVASPRIWARTLDRSRGGEAMALLCAMLGVATLLPVFSAQPVVAFASGLLFGAVFISLVTSTTAIVRHNLPPIAWSAGISLFTLLFALGQIVGPAIGGRIADGPDGLRRGLIFSALALFVGSWCASRQRALSPPSTSTRWRDALDPR